MPQQNRRIARLLGGMLDGESDLEQRREPLPTQDPRRGHPMQISTHSSSQWIHIWLHSFEPLVVPLFLETDVHTHESKRVHWREDTHAPDLNQGHMQCTRCDLKARHSSSWNRSINVARWVCLQSGGKGHGTVRVPKSKYKEHIQTDVQGRTRDIHIVVYMLHASRHPK